MNVLLRLWAAAAALSLLSTVVAVGVHSDRTPVGLAASYESQVGPPKPVNVVAEEPTTPRVLEDWAGRPPDAFSVVWRGVLYVPSDGAYTFATRVDGEATVYLDGRGILENGWGQPDMTVRQTVRPDAGPHNIAITYHHNGGPIHFELLWAHAAESLQPIPSSALWTRRPSWLRLLIARWVAPLVSPLEWLAVIAVVIAAGAAALRGAVRVVAYFRRIEAPAALGWIVAGSSILNVIGIGWGLPAGWAPIEMTPVFVLGALSTHYSNGWSDPYPPVHYVTLAMSLSPMVVLEWLGRINLHDMFWATVMTVTVRLVSVVMAAGTVAAVYVCGALAFNRRSGTIAAAIFALAAPLLYFGKLANVDVPYLFYFSLSLIFYLRVLEHDRMRDYLALALTTMLAICTKDQAYGLYLLPPIVILWEKGLNRRVIAAAITSLMGFAIFQNLALNWSGFLWHVHFLTGSGSSNYRLFEPTLEGRLKLLRLATRLTELSWGWPLFLVCGAGVLIALARRITRRRAIWLLAPIVGYYFGMLNVILYAYDRFMLPVCLVLAIFGGLALDTFLRPASSRSWRVAAVGLVFLYTLLYSSTVDVLLVRDSRYAAERWLRSQHITDDDLIAYNVLPFYVPRLTGYKTGEVEDIEDLQIGQPKFFILNVDYTRGEAPDSRSGKLIAALHDHSVGYSLVWRGRTPSPWPWLPGAHRDLVGPRLQPAIVSSLRYINPTIEIFQHDTTIGR
jgi:PA14 domain-containing protein/dolichyl-phosphate-mannose-protein mannosyltransferase